MAHPTPADATALGRSPSSSPAMTGKVAAVTAVIGAITVIAPIVAPQ
jgi:hypothetical protein